jgi:hypothetical protein
MKRLITFIPLIFLCCFGFGYQQNEKAVGEPVGDSDTSSWQLTQVGVVVKDVKQVAERLAYLGIGPFQVMELPADRQELFRGKPALADAKIMWATLARLPQFEVRLDFFRVFFDAFRQLPNVFSTT